MKTTLTLKELRSRYPFIAAARPPSPCNCLTQPVYWYARLLPDRRHIEVIVDTEGSLEHLPEPDFRLIKPTPGGHNRELEEAWRCVISELDHEEPPPAGEPHA